MAKSIDDFKRILRAELRGLSGVASFDAIQAALVTEVQDLVEQDAFDLGHDHRLGGAALEARVFSLLRKMGLTVTTESPDLWDAVLGLPGGEPSKQCVLEVKSGKGVSPTRSDLRQLDDWVFELSGEEQARKQGLGGGIDTLAMAHHGVLTSRQFHPTPAQGGHGLQRTFGNGVPVSAARLAWGEREGLRRQAGLRGGRFRSAPCMAREHREWRSGRWPILESAPRDHRGAVWSETVKLTLPA